MLQKIKNRLQRKARVRAKISWTKDIPRLNVYRSNKNIYAQLIDDEAWVTLFSTSDMKITSGNKIERAKVVWENIWKLALDKGIKKVVFDRWGFIYTWRVEALAIWARWAWLEF